MRTQVFSHKGYIGIKSAFDAEGLVNDPSKPGQLGFVLDASSVDVHPDALELLKKVPSSHDDIGDVDIFKTNDGRVVFSFLGGPLAVLCPGDGCSGSNSYHPELLTPNPDVVPDKEFVEYIDSL